VRSGLGWPAGKAHPSRGLGWPREQETSGDPPVTDPRSALVAAEQAECADGDLPADADAAADHVPDDGGEKDPCADAPRPQNPASIVAIAAGGGCGDPADVQPVAGPAPGAVSSAAGAAGSTPERSRYSDEEGGDADDVPPPADTAQPGTFSGVGYPPAERPSGEDSVGVVPPEDPVRDHSAPTDSMPGGEAAALGEATSASAGQHVGQQLEHLAGEPDAQETTEQPLPEQAPAAHLAVSQADMDDDEGRGLGGRRPALHLVPQVPHETAASQLPDQQAAPVSRGTGGGRGAKSRVPGLELPEDWGPKVVTVANQKGGVGKTTSTVNLAAALAAEGRRVLVIDLDPQGNASTALGIDHHRGLPDVYRVLISGAPLETVVRPAPDLPGLFAIPATIDLAGAEIELVPLVAREFRLRRALAAYLETRDDLDLVLIDCPPSLGLLTVNAMTAADEVLIPIQCEYYALEGLQQLLQLVELVKSNLNARLRVSTILLTMYDARTRLASQVADEVRTHFPDVVLDTVIPRSVRVSEAPSYRQTVITYDGTSSGALAYKQAARELVAQLVRKGVPA